MKKRNFLVLLLGLAFVLGLLSGCGASPVENYTADMAAPMEEPMAQMSLAEGSAVKEEVVVEEDSEAEYSTFDGGTQDQAMDVDQVENYSEKIIYSGYSHMETTEFDEALLALDQAVQQFGGFVQESSVNGNTRRNDDGTTVVVDRWGYYVVRIPAARFKEFMTLTEGIGNVISSNRNAENVTSQYTDYEARLESLYTQEERLMVMLEESGDLESLIKLEARLSEVRYEIESIERNLRNLDQRLSYSTVTLEIQEVEVYTPTAAVQRSFGEKISDAFREGWQGFSRSMQSFFVGLVYAMPTLLLLAVFAVAAALGIRAARKRRKKAQQSQQNEEN